MGNADAVDALFDQVDERLEQLDVVVNCAGITHDGGMLQAMIGQVALTYLERYPEVSLEVVASLENQIPDGETLHLALWTSDGTPPGDLIQRTVGNLEMCLCASPEWAQTHPLETLDDLL